MGKRDGALFVSGGVPDYDETQSETYHRVAAALDWNAKVLPKWNAARAKDRVLKKADKWLWIRTHFPPANLLSIEPACSVAVPSEETPCELSTTQEPPETPSVLPTPPMFPSLQSVTPDDTDSSEESAPTGSTEKPDNRTWVSNEGSFKDEVLEAVRWVFHSLPAHRRNRVRFSQAPNHGAWEMLETAKDDPKWFQQNVVNTVLKKLDEIEEAKRLRDDNRPVLALLDRVLPPRKGTGVGLAAKSSEVA